MLILIGDLIERYQYNVSLNDNVFKFVIDLFVMNAIERYGVDDIFIFFRKHNETLAKMCCQAISVVYFKTE